jgi:hypothetical protein
MLIGILCFVSASVIVSFFAVLFIIRSTVNDIDDDY